jgi:DUF1680 family protein
MKKKHFLNHIQLRGTVIFPFLCCALFCNAQYPGQHKAEVVVPLKVPVKADGFDLREVRLLPGRFKENMDREANWLLSLPNDRLLLSFRVNAGMNTPKPGSKTKMPQPLGGWEALDMELRGHSMGHILSGLSMQYASTGNIAFKQKSDSLVEGLAEVQQVLDEDGYLSAFPQQYINRNIAGKPVWAPWYTLHKLFSGLVDAYWYTGNQQALEVVNKMASWAYHKIVPLPPDTLALMLRNEFGGMNEAFYNLYSVTANPQHLQLAQLFYHHAVLDPLANRQDKLAGMHANTVIPKITGEARDYELTGNEKGRNIATFFWDEVLKNQTYAIGSNSDKEHFVTSGTLSKHLTGYTGETCNTYNMLKLTRHLFSWYAAVKYADYYEQALYNHILGQQDPASGMVCYFTPMLPGAYKLYSTRDNSFWCCVGSGFESQSKYGEAIFYHDDKGVFVNLFIPSELTWKEKGLKLRLETTFPETETISITLDAVADPKTGLYIRYPSWATNGVDLKINGKKMKISQQPGTYIVLDRKWKAGDKIEVAFPMSLRLVPTPDDPAKAAIAYGPVVLAAPMGTEAMVAPAPFHDPGDPYQYYNYDYHIPAGTSDSLFTAGRPVADWVKAGNRPLTFTLTDTRGGRYLPLVPYYNLHKQRYIIYWNLK